jgi:hypothetical protein
MESQQAFDRFLTSRLGRRWVFNTTVDRATAGSEES